MAQLPGWILCKKITIRDTYVDSDLVDFPVYIPIKADADFHQARADGHDIRFTLSDGKTLLKYEREHWTGGNGNPGTAHFWVKVPSILASGGAIIYVYYGKSDAPDGEDAPNVWDANFKGVWHLKDITPSTIADSTGVNDGTKLADNEPIEADGKVYKGQDFDGGDDLINLPDDLGYTTRVSAFVWFKRQGASVMTHHVIFGPGQLEISIPDPGGSLRTGITTTDGRFVSNHGSGLLDGALHCIGFTFDGTVKKSYIDGQYVGQQIGITGSLLYDFPARTMGCYGRSDYYPAYALVDEARISNAVRADIWIKFGHRNINEADNELTWGKEEGVYYGPGFPIFEKKKELLLIGERKPVFIGQKKPILISRE